MQHCLFERRVQFFYNVFFYAFGKVFKKEIIHSWNTLLIFLIWLFVFKIWKFNNWDFIYFLLLFKVFINNVQIFFLSIILWISIFFSLLSWFPRYSFAVSILSWLRWSVYIYILWSVYVYSIFFLWFFFIILNYFFLLFNHYFLYLLFTCLFNLKILI